MKHGKVIVILGVVLVACAFLTQGVIYAEKSINTVLPGDATEKKPENLPSNPGVENVVDVEFLASNTAAIALLNNNVLLLKEITGQPNVQIKLSGNAPSVTPETMRNIALNDATTLIAKVTKETDGSYTFHYPAVGEEGYVDSRMFYDTQVIEDVASFVTTVSAYTEGQIAIIVTQNEDIQKQLLAIPEVKIQIDDGKAVSVLASNNESFNRWKLSIDELGAGFSLRQHMDSPAVAAAREGSV